MSQPEFDLCCDILREHFGLVVEKVGAALIRRGRSNLAALGHSSKLSIKAVRECMFVLMHHRLATYAETAEGTRVVNYYEANVHNILLRQRFPLYLQKTREHFDIASEFVVRMTLENGLLTPPMLLQHQPPDLSEEKLCAAMEKLVDGGFVVVAIATDTVTLKDMHFQEEAEAIAKSATPLTSGEVAKLRKTMAAQRLGNDGASTAGSKRKVVVDFEEAENKKKLRQGYSLANDNSFYRINFEKFNVLLRNDRIAKLASDRINAAAGALIARLLQHNIENMKTTRESSTPLMQSQMLIRLAGGLDLPVSGPCDNKVMEYIKTLMADGAQIITSSQGQYTVNLANSVRAIQIEIIESIIYDKFGPIGRRIWRLLHINNKLDEKQVAKIAMVSNKVARESLYAMFRAGFVFLQDVPKTMDHSASRTFFLWYISVERTCKVLLQSVYRTMHNLKVRRFKELADRALVIEKSKRSDVLSGEAELTDMDKAMLRKLDSIVRRLYISEWRIDEVAMILGECQ